MLWNHQTALALLEKEGRTRKWLAERCGISPETLARMLGGRRRPGKPTMILLAQNLGCEVKDLLADDQQQG